MQHDEDDSQKTQPAVGLSVFSGWYVTRMALYSLLRFFPLLASGNLRLPKNRLGLTYAVSNHGNYKVFRETINTGMEDESPVVLVVGFRLKRINSNRVLHYLFQRICIITTPFWSGLAGFYIKLWMVDPATEDYAGIYEWKGLERGQEYLSALIPVLHFFSEKESVWYQVLPNTSLKDHVPYSTEVIPVSSEGT